MANRYLKLYRIKHFNVWPYEAVESVTPVDRSARAALTAEFEGSTNYRCYRRHPDRFITLAPMEAYDESWEGAGGREISPYQIYADRPLAFQIDYVLYQSWRASDYAKLHRLVENIKKGTLTPLSFPRELRPARVVVNGDTDSDPWGSRRLEGTQPPAAPTSTFSVSERSDIPYINHHTIPEGIDYGFVQAAVTTYCFYETPPIYGELMTRLDKYCDWFERILSDSDEKPLKTARTKRKTLQ